jgi:mannose-6-phosphate isomerase-like protein (cupin superfamily)
MSTNTGHTSYPYATYLNLHYAPLEFFFVLEGTFFVDLEDRIVELGPWQGFTVPKGVVHRTRAPERAVILMVENAGIVPTGD